MAQTFSEWKNGSVNNTAPINNGIPSFSEWKKSQPPAKPTLGSKVVKVGKEVVKGIISPVVTTVARPFQAVAELAGASAEDVNKYNLGGLIAPVPQNANDVVKDIGRAAQVPLLGVGGATLGAGKGLATIAGREALIGAGVGASGAIEQGGLNTTGKDLLIGSAVGAGIGAAVPVVGAGISKAFSKSTTKAIEDVALKQTIQDVGQQVEKTGVAQKLPSQKHMEYAKSQGYEQYVPPEQLPTIQTGNVPKSELPNKNYIDVYHGGSKIDVIDFNKSNYQKTFFVSDNPKYASEYGGKNKTLNKLQLDSNAKLIDIKNAPKDVIDRIREIGNGKLTGKTISITKPDGSIINIPEKVSASGGYGNLSFNETLDGAIRGKSHFAEDPNLVKIYKKLGYDGMISYEDSAMRGKNIGIWNKDVIKVPSKTILPKKVKGDFTYEPIKEPTPVKDYSTPEIKKPEISTKIDIPDTPEYTASVQERVNKLKEDPLFESSANADVIKLFDKTKATTSIDDLSNAIYGVGDKKLPQGLSEQAAFKLLREDSLLNPQNYTAKQMERLANSYPASMGGKQLQSLQVSKSGMKDTVYDFIDRQTKILKDKALSKGFTTKTISNFIDDIMCSM